ncbi:uncharacterized protein BDR25DRAFT_320470 [Lindgomyces ingoldianus]|uniref:Uncharacterized protein n=1 Tax=Lindgomyces ingoldianus TaxID=673940 RepID=A0ACB6Q7B2_9PLEO|nr:uncharacterized protein BDR25DRAFT_320470 [Lindgomyces ingoldianus]KAF2462793.1 hypothetical protein BDR25DRAFT_320470 [Lindgomyces ingoldianus]
MMGNRYSRPSPPLVLETCVTLLSFATLPLAVYYASEIYRAPANPHPSVTWWKTGGGTLYGGPPAITLLLSITTASQYQKREIPYVYAIVFSTVMLAGWLVTFIFWFQCHLDKWDITDQFCYQRLLQSGTAEQTYRNVSQAVGIATIACGALNALLYVIYVIVVAIDFFQDSASSYLVGSSSKYFGGIGSTAGGGNGGQRRAGGNWGAADLGTDEGGGGGDASGGGGGDGGDGG